MVLISYLTPAPIPQTTDVNSSLSESVEHVLKANIQPKTAQQQARSICENIASTLWLGMLCECKETRNI